MSYLYITEITLFQLSYSCIAWAFPWYYPLQNVASSNKQHYQCEKSYNSIINTVKASRILIIYAEVSRSWWLIRVNLEPCISKMGKWDCLLTYSIAHLISEALRNALIKARNFLAAPVFQTFPDHSMFFLDFALV